MHPTASPKAIGVEAKHRDCYNEAREISAEPTIAPESPVSLYVSVGQSGLGSDGVTSLYRID
jgi:hypothetical protein